MAKRSRTMPTWAWIVGAVLVAGIVFTGYRIIRTEQRLETAQTKPKNAKRVNQSCSDMASPVKQFACRVSGAATALVGDIVSSDSMVIQAEKDDKFRMFSAMKSMEYIQANVSSARYSYEKRSNPTEFIKPRDANEALSRGIGICGNHIAVFVAIMEELNIDVRTVKFFYETAPGVRVSHIAAEVFYDSSWHLFDVTWGAYYTSQDGNNILSIMNVLTNKQRKTHINNSNIWFSNSKNKSGIDNVLSYLHSDVDVVIDNKGIIRVYSKKIGDTYFMPLLHIPNYVGDNKVDGNSDGISYQFDVPAGMYNIKIQLKGFAGCKTSRMYINDQKIIFKDKLASLVVETPKTAEIKGKDDVCYYVLKDIEMAKIN